jgi:hypothetical protein
MSRFARLIRPFVDAELAAAACHAAKGDAAAGFAHLERAHVLGQASTREHVRVHWQMLLWAFRRREARAAAGQVFRLLGAASKTALGLVPTGNTGGTNVSPFRAMPIPADLAAMIRAARTSRERRAIPARS